MSTTHPTKPFTSPSRHETTFAHKYLPFNKPNYHPGTISTTTNNSRFHFHSDTKAPSQLITLERQTYNRHTEFVARLNSIDRQIAKWTTVHTTEVLDRDLKFVRFYDLEVCFPLERCGGRVLDKLERDLGSLWESRSDKRRRGNDTTANDADGDNMRSDEEKEAGRIEATHENGTNGICEGEAKGSDDDGISASINTAKDQNDERYYTNTPITDENNNPRPFSSPVSQPPITTYQEEEEEEEKNPVQNPAQPNERSQKKTKKMTNTSTIQSLSNKINSLSINLNTYVHKTIPDQCRESLESLHQNQLQADLPPKIHLEETKSAKREGFMVRRFESISGMGYRSVVEENATRLASLTILEEKITSTGRLDDERTGRFLAEVAEIRRMIRQERSERVKQDEVVLDRFLEARQILQRSLECLD